MKVILKTINTCIENIEMKKQLNIRFITPLQQISVR